MTSPDCAHVHDDLADLVAGDPATIARHADHLASCDDCRDARYEAEQLADQIADAGADHIPQADLVERVLAAAGSGPVDSNADTQTAAPAAAPEPAPVALPTSPTVRAIPESHPASEAAAMPAVRDDAPTPISSARRAKRTRWLAFGAVAALAVGGLGIYAVTHGGDATEQTGSSLPAGKIATVQTVDRAGKNGGGLDVRDPEVATGWRPVRPGDTLDTGATLRTDNRTRAAVTLADGTRYVLDHQTELALGDDGRHAKLSAGRIVADVVHVDAHPAAIQTPAGTVDVVGTRFALTAAPNLTVVQVVRGAVMLTSTGGDREDVRAGEEGVIDHGKLAVNAAPGLAREVQWSELEKPKSTEAGAGLGSLRAYKPGEKRDRDWNLALANHDVKVRIVGPIARTEITETFRNDTDETLEGRYQFPLPADAQIDGLALDVKDAPGGFENGAFVDKHRAQKIWNGVIDKATPKKLEIAQDDIIWVDGSWRDPAMLDWKRGGRFELKIFPIPPKGSRTIKLAYTQVVTAHGPRRQYVYPLPHSADGSTVADSMTVDVEVRGAQRGQVRASGYDLNPDPVRADVNALTLKQTGFVPRGDLVIDYRAKNGDAELRAWTFAGNAAVAPNDKLSAKKNVGIDPKVVDAQKAIAADARPTAVLALRPKLPRWREAKQRDYMIVVDSSQSMVGERYTRAGELATRLVEQMDRRDRFSVMACDSECRELGALRSPTVGTAKEIASWLNEAPAAGASDVVASIRHAASKLAPDGNRERWVLFVGDGFASTGFRKAADVEQAIAASTHGIHVSTIGIGTDADEAVLGAAARGGGGSYLAWVPGESVKTAAIAALESSYGTALRDATVTLPAGLADAAPTILPTIRSGEEVLLAARMTGDVSGDVIVKGTVGGEKFEQHYPLELAVSTASGNRFVPRLWATLAIQQLERHGKGDDRPQIVALSQGYGVMSKETSLLVLESQAMFDAFGVDRTVPAAKWTGEDTLDEVLSEGTRPVVRHHNKSKDLAKNMTRSSRRAPAPKPATEAPAAPAKVNLDGMRGGPMGNIGTGQATRGFGAGGGAIGHMGYPYGRFAMRRTWVRSPSISKYDGVAPSIAKAIGNAERALAKEPDSREKHRALVQALSYGGELARANALAAKWLDRDRLDPQALGYQADLLGRDGKREQALRLLAGIVDLDADRVEPHTRMVQAYEHVGRMSQACSHQIALSAIDPKSAPTAAAAVRCLRALSRDGDAKLVLRDLADDATRAETEKALLAPEPSSKQHHDVTVSARWEGNEDLDISLVTPRGTRVSWMGGRDDVHVTDATSTQHEELSLDKIKKGHYLVEMTRGGAVPSSGAVRGTLDIVALGKKQSVPFEITGTHVTVARLSINLEERIQTLNNFATVSFGRIPNARARRVMLARSPTIQNCFAGGGSGRMYLRITVLPGGQTQTRATGGTAAQNSCVVNALNYMHVEGSRPGAFTVPLTFRSNYSD